MKGPSFSKQLEPQTIAGFLLSDSWSSLSTDQHCAQKRCSSIPPNASRKDGWSPLYGSEELSPGIPSCTGPTCWKSLCISHQFAWSHATAVKSHSLLCGSCVGSYWTRNEISAVWVNQVYCWNSQVSCPEAATGHESMLVRKNDTEKNQPFSYFSSKVKLICGKRLGSVASANRIYGTSN